MIETDPLGQEVGTYDPGPEGYGDIGQYPEPHEFGNADDPRQGCEVDGIMHTPCSDLMRFANSGALRFRVQWYGNGSFRESSYNIDVVLGITANLRWNPVSGRQNPATPNKSPTEVDDGDVVKVETWGDGGIWEYVELFSLLVQTGNGRDIGDAARTVYNRFITANPDCDELAKKLGLDKTLNGAKFIDAYGDDKLMNKTSKELGFPSDPNLPDEVNEIVSSRTLGKSFERTGDGVTLGVANWKTQTIYFNGLPGPPVFGGYVVFHEALHLHFKGDHVAIAKALGLNYQIPGTTTTGKAVMLNNDDVANKSLEEFLKNGCKKPTPNPRPHRKLRLIS
jgi:hypothetical protein